MWCLRNGILAATLLAVVTATQACSDVGDSSAIPGLGGDDSGADADSTVSSSDDGPTEAAANESSMSETGTTEEASEEAGASPEAGSGPEPSGSMEAGSPEVGPSEAAAPAEAGLATMDAAVDSTIDAGSEAGPLDTGIEAAAVESGPDSTFVESGTADSASEATSGVEAGGHDGGPPDTGSGGIPTACTTSPCAAGGPNSVKCDGNTGTNAPANVCTPTEALFVNRDIAKGNLTGGQLSASSCYECLVAKECIDDDVNPDTGQECGDFAAGVIAVDQEPAPQACLDTLTCILASECTTANPPAFCFCGMGGQGAACLSAGAANGPCVQQEINGLLGVGGSCSNVYPAPLSCTEGDATKSNKEYKYLTSPAGMANAMMGCAYTNCEKQCTP